MGKSLEARSLGSSCGRIVVLVGTLAAVDLSAPSNVNVADLSKKSYLVREKVQWVLLQANQHL